MAKRKNTGDDTGSRNVIMPQVAELVAIGASIASNCEPCFKYHFATARKLGVPMEAIADAVAVAEMVKEAPDQSVRSLARKYLRGTKVGKRTASKCCSGSGSSCCC